MRVRTHFAKTEAMRYTGHLDLFRALERALRRAGLPLAYSEGFNPRPKINLAAALALGITSRDELADFWLEFPVDIEDIERQAKEAAPPGIQFLSFEEIVEKEAKLQNRVRESVYQAELMDEIEGLEKKVEEKLAADDLPRERTVKRKLRNYDLRPLILGLKTWQNEDGFQVLEMHLKAKQGATGRPDETLMELGIDPAVVRISRVKLILDGIEK